MASSRPPRIALLLALVLASVVAAATAHAQELLISAAVSTKDAVTQLGRTFMDRRPGVTVRFNFGASGELQKQIEAGAPVDLFISAAQRQMDELERRGLVLASSRRVFARNVLVAIRPVDATVAPARPADLLDPRVRRIAIGNPRTVPAGQYTEESLRTLGLWERLRARLVLAENVRQTLDYVARGEVDVGIVYATDLALRRDRVREAFRLPEGSHRPATYPVAIVKDSAQVPLAQAFIDLLVGVEGRAVLERFGFLPP